MLSIMQLFSNCMYECAKVRIYFHIRTVYYNIITQIRQTSKQFRQRSGEIWSESPLQSHPHTLKYCGFAVLRMKLVVRNRIDHTIFYQRYWGKEVGVPHNNFSCENQQQQLTSLQIDTYSCIIFNISVDLYCSSVRNERQSFGGAKQYI